MGVVLMIKIDLKKKREQAGFHTQQDLSSFCYLAQSHISKAEGNKIRPNDDTLMILAIALELDYREVLCSFKERTDEELVEILEQEKIDKKLVKLVVKIFTYLLKNDDSNYQNRFYYGPLKLIKGEILSGVKYRLEKAQEHLKDTGTVRDEIYTRIARREASRMFYSISRDFGKKFRGVLLEKIEEFNKIEDSGSGEAPREVFELTDTNKLFSIDGKLLSEKEIYSIVEHHLTTRRIEELFRTKEV